jgi:putative acetyltransferase
MIELSIREDDLSGERIRAFLREHLDNMHEITPPESVHALDVDGLRVPEVSFWSAWSGDELCGCGALREIDTHSGEIKSMRTVWDHRGRGVGSRILEHLIAVAEARGYERLLLETGALPEFEAARSLYQRYGFRFRGPFPPYADDPNSVFMEKRLAPR